MKPGVALNPATPVSLLEDVLTEVDLVLVMTVDPGFGGQAFLTGLLPKIARLREMVRRAGAGAEIAVDGGISSATAPAAVAAGAQVLVAGSAVFSHPRGVAQALKELRASLTSLTQEPT